MEKIRLFTNDILYCINIHDDDNFNIFALANHFRTKNDYIFNCFTYYCPIFREFTEMPMIFDILTEMPFDKQTEDNGTKYDEAFINGYNENLSLFVDTPQTRKELVHKNATKSFIGFKDEFYILDDKYFQYLGYDAGKRYKAWEIITQTPDEFADCFDKGNNQNKSNTNNYTEIPKFELPSDLLGKMQTQGFITIWPLKWLKSKSLLAYFVDVANNKLNLKHGQKRSIKPFETMFNVSGLGGCMNEYKNKTGQYPQGYIDIDRLFM